MQKNKTTRPNHAHWMLAFTPLAFLSGCYAFHNSFLILSLSEWALFLTSIMYWSKPACEMRRKTDMVIVQIALCIHLHYVFYYFCYTSLVWYKIGICFYIFGIFYDSNFFHACMWLCGSFGNYFLISHIIVSEK